MAEKQYIEAQQLLDDSFKLGLQILESGFRPDYIIGVWRGGTPVGIAVQEILDHLGIKTIILPFGLLLIMASTSKKKSSASTVWSMSPGRPTGKMSC